MRLGALPFVCLLGALLVSTAPAGAQVNNCLGAPEGTPCDTDGNQCTAPGTCFFGTCIGQSPQPNGTSCNDGVFCNGADSCLSAACTQHSGDPCPGPDGDPNCVESCNESADNCSLADPNGSPCNDGNVCTVSDSCSSGTCSLSLHAPNGTPCTSDGLFCTGAEACQAGSCVSPGNPCPGPDGDGNCAESCNEAADNCNAPDPAGSACNDGLFCNGGDSCLSGSCSLHGSSPCPGPDDDGNCSESCNETADTCNAPDPNGSPCNDGNECTGGDSCQGGACSLSIPVSDGTPCTSDGLFCTGVETCQTGFCASAGDPCAGMGGTGTCGDSCDEAADACSAAIEWGLTVRLTRSPFVPGDLALSWGADCLPAADYAVYEGMLGDFGSHVPAGTPTCSTGGATTKTLTPEAADSYYLIVPLDLQEGAEGSYGFASDWTPRLQSFLPCEPLTVCDCSSAPTRTVFVTSTAFSGNLGGLAGADAACRDLADAAGLGGTYKAWLSDSTTRAADRLTHSTVPYVRTDGQAIADNWADLIDNPGTDPLLAGIMTDEQGNPVPNSDVWTGTTFAGNTIPGDLVCSDWTDGTAASSGRAGRTGSVDLGWTSFANRACNVSARLYCFEQ